MEYITTCCIVVKIFLYVSDDVYASQVNRLIYSMRGPHLDLVRALTTRRLTDNSENG